MKKVKLFLLFFTLLSLISLSGYSQSNDESIEAQYLFRELFVANQDKNATDKSTYRANDGAKYAVFSSIEVVEEKTSADLLRYLQSKNFNTRMILILTDDIKLARNQVSFKIKLR